MLRRGARRKRTLKRSPVFVLAPTVTSMGHEASVHQAASDLSAPAAKKVGR
jgi:hypothetical protein